MKRIPENNLHQYLTGHLQAEITNIEPVAQGEWSQAFFFTARGQRKVIRFSTFDEDFQKDRFIARYSAPTLPVPQIEEIGEAFGLFFAISPFVDGKLIDYLSAGEMRQAVPALMELLDALRVVDGSRSQGYGGIGVDGNGTASSWREFLTNMTADTPESRLRGWKENLARDKEAERVYRQGRQRLLDLVPLCPEERHLVHNDLLHFNLIVKENRVAAVIDWGCALWGDFLYDLAMFATWQFYYPAMAGIDFLEDARRTFAAQHVSLPHFTERLQCYQLHLLLDSLAYNAWKEDRTNMGITIKRLKEILANPGSAS